MPRITRNPAPVWLVVLAAGAAATLWASQPEGTPATPPATNPPAPAQPAAEPPKKPAQLDVEAIVHFKDGRRMVGFLISEDKEKVVIRIEQIDTPIPMDLVDHVERLASIVERYKELRATIDNNDTERLLLLVEWLHARRLFELAVKEVDHVLEIQPDNVQAKKLKTLVTQQMELERLGKSSEPGKGVKPQVKPAFPTLSNEEVNLLRVYQVDLSDPPRMLVPREMVSQLIAKHGDSSLIPSTEEGRQALYRKRPAQILKLAFDLKARDLYGMVQVQDEPQSLRLFRDNVARGWLVNTCATSRCHGGEEAGRLWLSNRRTNADATIYTNFYILHEYKLADGTPLINYEKPADSPLLQMALRPEASKRPHPRVQVIGGGETFKPAFQSAEDRRFQETIQWLKAMQVPEGRSYPISYKPPVPRPPGSEPAVDPKKGDPETEPKPDGKEDPAPDRKNDPAVNPPR